MLNVKEVAPPTIPDTVVVLELLKPTSTYKVTAEAGADIAAATNAVKINFFMSLSLLKVPPIPVLTSCGRT